MYLCVVLCIVCFVTLPVSFVCTCVPNTCHRVATQLQLNISYHIIQIVVSLWPVVTRLSHYCFQHTFRDLYASFHFPEVVFSNQFISFHIFSPILHATRYRKLNAYWIQVT